MYLKDIIREEIKEGVDYFKGRVGITLVIISGIIACGMGTICCYKFSLFEKMPIDRLILLSAIISLPTFLWFIFWEANDLLSTAENEVYLFCLEENTLTFLVVLCLKMFVPQLTIRTFAVLLFIVASITVPIARKLPVLFVKRKKSYEIFLKQCKRKYPELYEYIINKIKSKDENELG